MAERPGREVTALDLLEQAVHLLRTAPASAWAVYLLGTTPFLVGFLLFWADMTHSPFAREHNLLSAAGLVAAFAWMRFWQGVFCGKLRAQVANVEAPAWSLRRACRTMLVQLALASWGFLAALLALVVMIPYAWVYAWYQNLVAQQDGREPDRKDQFRRAQELARLWPGQNHLLISLLWLVRFFIFINWATVAGMLPYLLKSLFGLDNQFTETPLWLLNTTFYVVVGALTYLTTDPLVKAAYVLRCFYGDSIQSGLDLATELRGFAALRRTAALGALFLLLSVWPAGAATNGLVAAGHAVREAAVGQAQLDEAIDEVMHRREFVWRMPRDWVVGDASRDLTLVERWLRDFQDWQRRMFRKFTRSLERWMEWLNRWLRLKHNQEHSSDRVVDWNSAASLLSWLLLTLLACLLGVLALRAWKKRGKRVITADTAPMPATPDLEAEDVLATQLPEEEWLALAADLRKQGEYRKALRACFLAALSVLARVQLVEVRRSKSNREYLGELERKARRVPAAAEVFGGQVSVFERCWYGNDEVAEGDLDAFIDNLGRLKRHVEA